MYFFAIKCRYNTTMRSQSMLLKISRSRCFKVGFAKALITSALKAIFHCFLQLRRKKSSHLKIEGAERTRWWKGSAYVVYCITCTFSKKLYISETERRLGDRFREHLLEVERNDEDITTRHKFAKWEYVARSHN